MGTNHGLGPMACVRCTWLAVHGAQHFPQRREAAFQAVPMWMSMHHGGARTCGNIVLLGEGSCLSPNSVAVTYSRPVLQHGHCDTSILPTRVMKAWADSTAWGFDRRHLQSQTCGVEFYRLAGRGQHPIVANAFDAGRQHMQHEAAYKLRALQPDQTFAALAIGAHLE